MLSWKESTRFHQNVNNDKHQLKFGQTRSRLLSTAEGGRMEEGATA